MPYAEHIPEDWKVASDSDAGAHAEAPKAADSSAGITLLAFLAGTVLAASILLPGVARGVAFGRWQGLLADESGLLPVPLLSSWCADAARWFYPDSPLLALNFQTAIFSALAAGALAMFTFQLSQGLLTRSFAFVAALVAAGLLAGCPAFYYESTAASPLPLTLLLALLSTTALLHQASRPSGLLLCALSGFAAGLATANHPSFALLLPILILWIIVAAPEGTPIRGRSLGCTMGFVIAALLPLQFSMRQGETFREFLAHSLYSPYPAPGTWPPTLDYGNVITELLPALVLLPAVAGIYALFHRDTRVNAIFAIMLFLCFGPMLLTITNNHLSPLTPYPEESPLVLALAILCMFTGLGLSFVLSRLLQATPFPRLRPVAAAFAATVYFTAFWSDMPDRNHTWADDLGRELLESCRSDATLITGDPLLTSLALAARAQSPEFSEVEIVPTQALYDIEGIGNRRLTKRGLLPPSGLFDSNAPARWRHELASHTGSLGEYQTDSHALEPMLLWDFVTVNFSQKPANFVGVSTPWLTARADRNGLVLRYPGRDDSHSEPGYPLHTPERVPNDPHGPESAARILLPLSDQARQQASAGSAHRLARTAQSMMPDDPAVHLAALRAQARAGDREASLRTMTEYLESNRNDTATAPVETVLESDLARHTSETDLLDYLNDLGGQEADWDRRNEYLAPLWAAEEFILLALAYERIQQHFALDLDATYQLAAVRAQLGDWAKVNHLIQVWQRIGAFSDEDVQNALLRDGRFAHYIRYRRVIARTTPQT